MARVLIDRFQGDINETNRKGETLLFIAAQAGNLEVCQYLVGRGAKIDAMSNIERTPLLAELKEALEEDKPGHYRLRDKSANAYFIEAVI